MIVFRPGPLRLDNAHRADMHVARQNRDPRLLIAGEIEQAVDQAQPLGLVGAAMPMVLEVVLELLLSREDAKGGFEQREIRVDHGDA